MKIILSRKGFDSSLGEVPSPIFPSGELCSLPIPESMPDSCSARYEEIKVGERSLGTIVNDLTQGKIKGDARAHLDPDLNSGSIPRQENWKPVFGQAGAAESHLQNKGVKEADVFVFYGWFRQIEQAAGIYRYVKDAPDLHLIFGWLQIERRISVDNRQEIPSWALDHPHCKRTKCSKIDSIYISSDQMKLSGVVIIDILPMAEARGFPPSRVGFPASLETGFYGLYPYLLLHRLHRHDFPQALR